LNIVAEAPLELEHALTASGGPWGRLEFVPLVVAPTGDFISRMFHMRSRGEPWRFPGLNRDGVADLFATSGVEPAISRRLLDSASAHSSGQGVTLLPDDVSLRQLTAGARGKLYAWLAGALTDSPQADAFRFFGESLDEWFADAPLSPATIELVRPYVYRQGGYLLFADLHAVAGELSDQAELLRLARVLLRERTSLVKLDVGQSDDLDQLVRYWGCGGREDFVRPLLESLAQFRRGQQVDIVHLLPAFARRHIYTYPLPIRGAGSAGWPDCFWTALNFFNDTADDRLLDPDTVKQTFRRDWRYVADVPQLGDIAMFHDEREVAHHAAVYLADDILFSKNGSRLSRPWVLTRREQLEHLYWRDAPLAVRFFRRVDL
jgi:hypothetical protein